MINLTLAIDTMGGDFGPSVTVPASEKAVLSNSKLNLLLVGDPQKISILLSGTKKSVKKRLKIIPATSVIKNNINIFKSIRKSKHTSMRIALELVKNGTAQACISAGNTGILMALSKVLLKPLKNIKRPALVGLIPNFENKKTLVLDLGANINCNSTMLVQFAIMGSILAECIFNIPNPRIGLLNIAKEINKGPNNIQDAEKILKNYSKINYIGYIESNNLLNNKTDVLICDGFVGNVMLKTIEGAITTFFSFLKNNNQKKQKILWIKKIKNWINKISLKKFSCFNPDQYNGAYLLGLQGIVIKSHGAANKKAFFFAIDKAHKIAQKKILHCISSRIENIFPKSD